MKSIVSIILFSLLFTACQQTRLINLRNLTLVEGETEIIDDMTENDPGIAADINHQVTFDRPQTTSENNPNSALSIDFSEAEVVDFPIDIITSEASFTEERNELPNELINPNQINNPPILSDSTKTESEKPSKKVSGKILWVFGGLSLIALLLFAAVVALGVFLIILFLWIVFGGLF